MSYDDDDNSEEYECVNEGCVGENMFLAAPEEWFENRGMDTPKNCDECREWIDEQKQIGPIDAVCQFCSFHWPIPATYRIMYHRHTGNWDAYWQENESLQMCRRCAEFPTRRHRLMRIAAERKYRDPSQRKSERERLLEDEQKDAEKSNSILTSGSGSAPQSYLVPAEALYYHGVKTWPDRIGAHGETQLTHILKDDHKWGEKFGTNDPGTILTLAAHIAGSTGPHIREFVNAGRDTGRVIKYDTQQRVVVIIIGDKTSPTRNRIETAFPADPKYVFDRKIKEEKWK